MHMAYHGLSVIRMKQTSVSINVNHLNYESLMWIVMECTRHLIQFISCILQELYMTHCEFRMIQGCVWNRAKVNANVNHVIKWMHQLKKKKSFIYTCCKKCTTWHDMTDHDRSIIRLHLKQSQMYNLINH